MVTLACRHFQPLIHNLAEGFDLIILNAMMFGVGVNALPETSPLMWYIHEGRSITKYNEDYPEFGLALNKCPQIFVVNQYAQSCLPDHIKSRVLHLGVSGMAGGLTCPELGKLLRFAVVGTFGECKGQNLIIKALGELNEEELDQVELLLIGKCERNYYHNLKKNCPPPFTSEIC